MELKGEFALVQNTFKPMHVRGLQNMRDVYYEKIYTQISFFLKPKQIYPLTPFFFL